MPVIEKPDGARIAYQRLEGRSPTVVFLGGFASDMTGTKATALETFCRARGQAYLRFDYQGHGTSSGAFADGTIGRWADDARFAVEHLTEGPLVLVGSSMGGWIMLLVALVMSARIHALVGVAAAPDFTEDMWRALGEADRERLARDGRIEEPSEYSREPYVITRALIEDGREHLLLGGPIGLSCPVRLIQGERDPDVPWDTALEIMAALRSDDVRLILVKGGDHRMSDPAALALLTGTLAEVLDGSR